MAGIKTLRYAKRSNLKHEQAIQKEYFREIINSYGIDSIYFRKYLSYFKDPSGLADYTYGEDPTASYYLSGNMIIYMEQMGDSFLLSNLGIQTDGDANVYFTIEDFNEQFRDDVGVLTSAYFESSLTGNLSGGSGYVIGEVANSEISGFISGYVQPTSGIFSGSFIDTMTVLEKPVNPYVAEPNYYNYGVHPTTGDLTGNYTGFLDASGNGDAVGIVSGNVMYYKKPDELHFAAKWVDVSPQVGDFFRIDFDGLNNEEYEITRIQSRNLETDGLNPLMGTYIFKCNCVRRDPSHEDVIGEVQEEPLTPDLTKENVWHETVSDEIFEYDTTEVDDIDGKGSSDVYGGY